MGRRKRGSARAGAVVAAVLGVLWAGACTATVDLSNLTGGEAGSTGSPIGGQGGVAGSEGGGGEGGATGECTDALDCPPTDHFCVVPICLGGSCGTLLQGPGTALPAAQQQAGDCRTLVCAADGQSEEVNDDLDEPASDDCAERQCISGELVTAYVAFDTACSGGGVCDGEGLCVACNAVSTCQVDETLHPDCWTLACADNVCTTQFAPPGTPVQAQLVGDCAQVRCDGTGRAIAEVDDTDVPDDSNDCTDELCLSGTPSNPARAMDIPCGDALVCDGDGSCVGCTTPAQCGTDTSCTTWSCEEGTCSPLYAVAGTPRPPGEQPAGTCQQLQCNGLGGTNSVTDDSNLPLDDGLECTSEACLSGVPMHPARAVNQPCSELGGAYCDGGGACVECNSAGQCADPPPECEVASCVANVCGSAPVPLGTPTVGQVSGDCKVNVCNGSGSTTTQNQDSDKPFDNNDCTGDVCTSGVPSNPALPVGTACTDGGGKACDGAGRCVPCTTDGHCAANQYCNAFACVADKPNGQTCTRTAQCLSGYCPAQDGVCCATACTAFCSACVSNKTGVSSGTCSPVINKTDPDNECGAYLCLYPGCCYESLQEPKVPGPSPQAEDPPLGPCP